MINYQPPEGSVLYCDYTGFISPEMIKKRPVVVTKKHSRNSKLVTVVPISMTEPIPVLKHHIPMEVEFCKLHLKSKVSWVKCDMINVISLDRLHMVKNHQGERYIPRITPEELEKIREGIKLSQGL